VVTVEGDLFDGYDPGPHFDEVFDGCMSVRPHYAEVVGRLAKLGAGGLQEKDGLRDKAFRTRGITFTLSDDDAGIERTFPMDLFPRVIPAAEWELIEGGLTQRVKALNLFLDDIYSGERAILRDGVVPEWLVLSSSGFVRQAVGIPAPQGSRCTVAGIDIVRGGDGAYHVLEDNLQVPSGISYVVENRIAMTRLLPGLFGQHVRPVDHYPALLLSALRSLSPANDPTVVVLTPGIYNAAFFEHAFLAREMGVELVEGRDLVVDEHCVFMRTTRGLERVDVIYRRVGDEWLDPVAFRRDSLLGVPGLTAAVRAGQVVVTNGIGNGVADDKAVYPYVPDMIRYYLDEDALLPNVTTYLLWEPDQRRHALDRLDELVIKPVAESGGHGLVIGRAASDEQLAEVAARIEDDPRGFIAQEVVSLSRHPTLIGDRFEGRHIDLRPFVVTGERVEVIPGGLTRVALRRGSLIVNSSQGGGSKDTWVLAANGDG
jgi:uncharacterized circularly permuted ATP-grasp superfamily protein